MPGRGCIDGILCGQLDFYSIGITTPCQQKKDFMNIAWYNFLNLNSYNNRGRMKKKIIALGTTAISITLLSHNAYAVILGGYGALGLGQTRIQIPSGNVFNAAPLNGYTSTQVGELNGKIMLGYNFYKYFGLEVNFGDYARSQYSAIVTNGPSAHLKYVMSALSIVGKIYVPFPQTENPWYNLSPYGIIGLSEAWSNTNYQNSGIPLASGVSAEYQIGGTDTSSLRPIFGGGVSYDIPDTMVSIGVEFTRIQGTGNPWTNARAIVSAEMLTVNVGYSFGKTPFKLS
jgi:hypothetical protein